MVLNTTEVNFRTTLGWHVVIGYIPTRVAKRKFPIVSMIYALDIPQKPELIIRENQPVELPPDVVRSSDKNDLGLSELQQLNVKERYNIFENAKKDDTRQMLEREERILKRGNTVLSKMAKYVFAGSQAVVHAQFAMCTYAHRCVDTPYNCLIEYDFSLPPSACVLFLDNVLLDLRPREWMLVTRTA